MKFVLSKGCPQIQVGYMRRSTRFVIACVCLWMILPPGHCQPVHEIKFKPKPMLQVAEKEEGEFTCLCPGAYSHHWGINGEFPADDKFPQNLTRTPPSGGFPAMLIIPAIPKYNNTVIKCGAVLDSGGVPVFVQSESTTLIIQGPLHPVTDLYYLPPDSQSSSTTITISWSPPFSLNLTFVEPDIQYCVDVYNVTGGGDDHLQSVCDITDTYYTFTASDPDQLFNFTVTPRSNVEGSLNGTTSQPVQGSVLQEPAVINSNDVKVVGAKPLQLTFPKSLLGPPGRTPRQYVVEVTCLYPIPTLVNHSATPNISNGLVKLLVSDVIIEDHQICNISSFAENMAGVTKYSSSLFISTHHIKEADVTYSHEQIDVNCTFLEGSSDLGFLAIVSSPQNSVLTYFVAHRNISGSTISIVSIPGAFMNASVYIFDLQNEVPFPEKWPAVIQHTTGHTVGNPTGNTELLLQSFEVTSVDVSSVDGEICLSCSFSADEVTGCVGVIHSAQLEDLTLTVLTVERSGGVNCTTNITERNYTVAVFGWSGKKLEQEPVDIIVISTTKKSDPSEDIIALEILCVLVVVLLLVVVMVAVQVGMKIHKSHVDKKSLYRQKELFFGNSCDSINSTSYHSPETDRDDDVQIHNQLEFHPFHQTESTPPVDSMPQQTLYAEAAKDTCLNLTTFSTDPLSENVLIKARVSDACVKQESTHIPDDHTNVDGTKLAPSISSNKDIHEEEFSNGVEKLNVLGDEKNVKSQTAAHCQVKCTEKEENVSPSLGEIGETEAAENTGKVAQEQGVASLDVSNQEKSMNNKQDQEDFPTHVSHCLDNPQVSAPDTPPPHLAIQQAPNTDSHDNCSHDEDAEQYTSNVDISKATIQETAHEKKDAEIAETPQTSTTKNSHNPDITSDVRKPTGPKSDVIIGSAQSYVSFQSENSGKNLNEAVILADDEQQLNTGHYLCVYNNESKLRASLKSFFAYNNFHVSEKDKLRIICRDEYSTEVEDVYQKRMQKFSSAGEEETLPNDNSLSFSTQEKLAESEIESIPVHKNFIHIPITRAITTNFDTVFKCQDGSAMRVGDKSQIECIQTAAGDFEFSDATGLGEQEKTLTNYPKGSHTATNALFGFLHWGYIMLVLLMMVLFDSSKNSGDFLTINVPESRAKSPNNVIQRFHFFHLSLASAVNSPGRKVQFKGICLVEHGCIFQPGGEDTIHLASVGASGELQMYEHNVAAIVILLNDKGDRTTLKRVTPTAAPTVGAREIEAKQATEAVSNPAETDMVNLLKATRGSIYNTRYTITVP